ncbi:hypothetical protein AK812_SmicGene24556 [Symbiodinium microadriaticum]|uniref:Uncharacterized protein n=1 Tax=Symbiodinium microadriaticum TaxID=2951 RepID=A0A1Q9DE94_SYMMI|nr:hypothetical protein AK812_SmicGene24556 [Symbiodinium microadriaticum]
MVRNEDIGTGRRLHKQFSLPERARATNQLNEISGFRLRNGHLESELSEFMILENRHEKTTGSPLNNDLLNTLLMQKSVGPLQQHLRLNVRSFNSFNEALEIVYRYTKSRHLTVPSGYAANGFFVMKIDWRMFLQSAFEKGVQKRRRRRNKHFNFRFQDTMPNARRLVNETMVQRKLSRSLVSELNWNKYITTVVHNDRKEVVELDCGLAACRFDHPDQRSNAIMSSLRMRMSSLGINTERNGPNNWMIETGWVTMTKAERLFLTKENWHVERRFLHYAFPCHQLIWLVQCSVVTVEDCAGNAPMDCWGIWIFLSLNEIIEWGMWAPPMAKPKWADACLAAPHSPTLMNTVRGVPAVRGQADFCCSQCGVNCYDPITTTEAPRVVVRRHYNTVVRCASFQFSPTPIGLLIYVAVQKPNAHYECFNGGDYDHEMWSAAHKRWCCYKYKEGCPKQVVDRNIYHHVTKIQKLHVPVPVQIIHNIPQVYHVPSPPKYVHVPVPGPKVHKVTINKDVPYPVKEPPQVITVKKPYTVKVPGHYVDVPVPSPPHIVNKYKYHYVTVHDYAASVGRALICMASAGSNGAARTSTWAAQDACTIVGSWHHHHVVTITGVQHLKHYDCHAGLSNWYHGWSHVKKSWCCDHHQLGCPGMAHGQWHAHTVCNWHGPDAVMDTEVVHTIMGHHAGHGGYDCDAGYSNWEHGWSYHKKTYCCEHEHKGCQPYHCHHHEEEHGTWSDDKRGRLLLRPLPNRLRRNHPAPCTLHGDTSTCKQRIGWSMEHTFDGKENACGLAYSAVQVECDVCRACTIQEAGCGDQGNAALGNWPWPRCRAWSPEKKVWCCQNEQKGCQNPDTPPDCDAGAGMVWKHLGSRASSHGKVFVSNHWTWQASHGVRFVVGNARAAFGRPLAQLGHGMVGAEEDVVPALPPSVDGHGCCSHEKVGCPGYHYAGAGGGGQTVVTTHTVVSGGGGGSFGGAYSFHGHPPSAAGSGMMWHWVVHTHGNLPFDCFAGITAGWSGGKKHFCCLHFDKGLKRSGFAHLQRFVGLSTFPSQLTEISVDYFNFSVVVLEALTGFALASPGGGGGGAGAGGFEEDAEASRTEERWAYVGAGQGTYRQTSQMDYVGHGPPFNFFQTGADEMVPAPDPCMTGTVGAMTVMQREACCAQGNVAFCATTTKAPVIIHDKPLGMCQVITTLGMTKGRNAENLSRGYGSWKTQWSHEHQRYCCYKFKEACVTKVQYRNHYKTITHVHHVTVPEKVVVPAPPPREINHIVKDPSPVIKIKTAGPPRVVKHYVTKKHYVPEPVPSPPTYRYKHVAVPVHVPGKVVHVPVPMPAKTIYKEVPVTKVQHVIQKRYYDCVAGFKNWHFGWSKTKKSWCCSHEQRGCPGTWQGDGLTKTIVTGVTQHIGHGHVHVIHHVHHYSTSSHDVDDLVGDDDASLPPEYRHGDTIVGGDDESLPPEYRHGDMGTYGDDDSVDSVEK